jgi:Sec-independent protein translocase protein TatA
MKLFLILVIAVVAVYVFAAINMRMAARNLVG